MEDDSINDPEVDKLGKGKEHATEDFEGELQVSASAFEALERDFQEVLSDLIVDESLEKFRLEYEKLHRALKKSHEQEKRLVKKCRELNSEILNNQAKIKTALRLSQEDQKTITHLQKEMEKTWKLVYMTQEKETRAKETIGQLKEEMVNLSKLVERGAGLSINQENLVKELKQAKEELQRQVDEQAASINMIETQLHTQHKVQEELRGERDEANRQISDLRERLGSKESDNLREVKRREKTQKELQDARARLDDKAKQEENLSAEILAGKNAVVELERQLSDVKATMDKHLKDYESLHTRSTKVSEDLSDQVERNKKLLANYNELEVEMKKKSIEVLRLKDNVAAVTIKYEREREVVKTLKEDLAKTETPLLLAQNELENLKKELLSAHRHEVQLSKVATKVEREKEVQLKATERAEARTKEQQDLFIEKEREATSLATEMQAHIDENRRLRKAIAQLDSDRERLGNEVGEQRNKYIECEDKLKLREIEMSELNKVIIEGKNKEKHQQQLYEAVRADRNHYSKGLLESQDEIAELKKKFKILGHQIEQLKEEISLKDQAIVKEHGDFQKAEKKSEINKKELSAQTALVKTCHELIHQQENELKNLTSIVRRMDEEALAQRKEYDQVINERDILGTQLIRRNDELALLYEKLRIQQSALKKGEVQYAARLDDIRILKLKLKEFIRENSLNKGSGLVIEDLKREILQFQRELLQEKTKVTALSEELENPMNVHRWRKLEGSDPATFELIQKIQTLQRRLISKTEEVVEKGLIIQEKEKLYNELKGILARQPGPEVAEQLAVYQQNLKKKTAQMKAMASELNMCQAQVNEYKYEQERLLRELTEMKRKYYQQKRKDKLVEELEYEGGAAGGGSGGVIQMSRTDPSSLQHEQTVAAKNARVRYTGGGYAIR